MGFLGDLFGGEEETITQEPMLTKAQKDAQKILSGFAQTGQYGDLYQAGETYGGDLGYYQPSKLETAGQSNLMDLVTAGVPEGMETGESELMSLLTTDAYNPLAKGIRYKPLLREIEETGDEAIDRFTREQAKFGSPYSTRTTEGLADIEEEVGEQKQDTLRQLYENYLSRRLGGATDLSNLAGQQESLKQNRIQQAMQVGQVNRILKDAQAKAEYQEWQRANQDKLRAVDTALALWNKNVPYGMKSFTKESPSTFMSMLGEVSPLVGSYNTAKYGYTANQSSLSDIGTIADFLK